MPHTLLSLLAVFVPCIALAQQQTENVGQSPQGELRVYTVRVTEFRVNAELSAELSAADVLKSLHQLQENGKVELFESVCLSALESQRARAQFGRRVTMVSGVTSGRPGPPVRSYSQSQVGTLLEALVESEGEKLTLQVQYEASHVEPGGSDEPEDYRPPDIGTISVETTLSLVPGQPVLLAGARQKSRSSFLLVVVERE